MELKNKIDPRANKGLCSTCSHLQVRVSDTGHETVTCGENDKAINRVIAACTEHHRRYTQVDDGLAWVIEVSSSGKVAIVRDSEMFRDGRWHVYRRIDSFHGEWVPREVAEAPPTTQDAAKKAAELTN